MQRNGLRQSFHLAIVGSLLFLTSCRTLEIDTSKLRHGESAGSSGAALYAHEFREFKVHFEPFVAGLERCLEEIDRLGTNMDDDKQLHLLVASDPECVNSEQQRDAAYARSKEIRTKLEIFAGLRQHPYRSPYGGFDYELVEASRPADEVEYLLWFHETLDWLYGVKTKQFKANPLRVKSMEAQVEIIRGFLSDSNRAPGQTR